MSAGIADRAAGEGQVSPGDKAQVRSGDEAQVCAGDDAQAGAGDIVLKPAADPEPEQAEPQAPGHAASDAPADAGLTADLGPAAPAGLDKASQARAVSARATMSAAVVLAAARWTRWLEPELLGLSELVGPGSVCVDVGSAAGIYTAPLSRLAGPTGLVHSIEPLPFAWPTWNRLLNTRNSPNVRYHAVALSSEPGEASMSVPRGRFGLVTGRSFISQNSSGLGSNAEFARHIDFVVPVKTLDGLLAGSGDDRLDFIKIDVEGAELHVLQGGRGVIEAFRPAMLIEIEARHTSRYDYDPEDVVAWLVQRGYTMHTWQRGWQQADTITAATRNYLFLAR